MALYASLDTTGRDVEIGIDAEYTLMQQSSILTACGGVAATSRTGQRGVDR
jgi:hypothetical protein